MHYGQDSTTSPTEHFSQVFFITSLLSWTIINYESDNGSFCTDNMLTDTK